VKFDENKEMLTNENSGHEVSAVLSVKETARILKSGENQVYNALNKGQLPGFKLGGSWKIPRVALMKMVNGE
jgi:excisionase family DNA binding protein